MPTSSKPLVINILSIILLIPVSLVSLIFCTFVVLPVCLLRQLVIVLAKVFKSSIFQDPIVPKSNLFLSSEDPHVCPYATIVSILIVEGLIDIDYIRDVFRSRVIDKVDERGELVYPELRQYVEYWMGFGFWRHVEGFDLKECIRIYEGCNDATSTDFSFLSAASKKLSFKPFPKGKPLWEWVLFPNFIPDPQVTTGTSPDMKYTAVIIRCHHGLADAFSQFGIVQSLSNKKLELIMPSVDKTSRNGFSRLVNNLKLIYQLPFTMSQMVARRVFLLCKASNVDTVSMSTSNPSDLLCTKFSKNFDIQEISEIKTKNKVSGTVVLYSAIIGALQNMIVMGSSWGIKIPKELLVVTPLPMGGAKEKLRNHYTLGTTIVPLDENDPTQRLHKVHKCLEDLRHSKRPMILHLAMQFAGSFPRFVLRKLATLPRKGNVVLISNVAGPKGESDFAGYRIVDFLVTTGAAVLISGGLGVSILSLNGKVRIMVAANKNVVGSSEKSLEDMIQSFFNELELYKRSEGNLEAVVCENRL